MRPASSGSLVKSMPGITWAAQKATCSVSAKKLSGLRLSTSRPIGVTGTSSSGMILVASSRSKLNFPASSSGINCTPKVHSGYSPGINRLPQVAAMEVRIGTGNLHRLIPHQRMGAQLGGEVEFDEGGLALPGHEAEGVHAKAL